MIVRKHDSHGWWAENDQTGEVVTKRCPTEKELHDVLVLVAIDQIGQAIERMGVSTDKW